MAMDFFANQDAARRKTSLLVGYFVAAVVLIILGVYAAVIAILFGGAAKAGVELSPTAYWNPGVFLWTTAITLAVVVTGTLFKIGQLRGGGAAVARMLGGTPISPDTRDPAERQLLNVVEEMAIASGIPVPPVYRINDQAINAFAAGFTPSDCVIGVTDGCMQQLSRNELQGVIGHEFSHILNGDMRLNIRLMGVLHGILVIALVGYYLMRATTSTHSSRSSKKGGNPLPLLGLALMLIGYVGVFFGKLIKSAVSRQREFLADASAVQFTRNPDGLSGALQKIGGLKSGSRITSPNAEQASHLFFANALRSSLGGALATHPPLAERIRRIDPQFDGTFSTRTHTTSGMDDGPVSQLSGDSPQPAPAPPVPPQATRAAEAVAQIGAPGPEHFRHATELLAAVPEAIRSQVREPFGARAIVYALLLDEEATVREKQLAQLQQQADPAVFGQTLALMSLVMSLPAQARLPVVELAVPALRQLSPQQYAAFGQCVQALVDADNEISLFEYALQRMLMRHLAPTFTPPKPAASQTRTMREALPACIDLLSTLAYFGHDDMEAARQAFTTAFGALRSGTHADIRPLESSGLAAADTALDALAATTPQVKKRILEACATCVASDGMLALEEAEMLRAIADALDCPMPPLLAA